ncbi:cobalt-precorrin-6A reductase [Gloeobacter morelensis MG652769]|uniref:Cobalt-precorrin-6A reductase n=2 Tax=Gloeobacter TaxID=33071 RepID=A0ABY3PPY7_9CYAN|nr:cobalt-precorrin-6A reductase [Gloeobacter morelensis MG652769]
MSMIWLIGGTGESRSIAQALTGARVPWVATVTTARAAGLYTGLPGQVGVGPLNAETLGAFLAAHRPRAVVDASHPFAAQISRLAMAAGLPYLRYERPSVSLAPETEQFPDFAALLHSQVLDRRRVLLTIGVKALPLLASLQGRAALWARVLPESAEQAHSAGFALNRLILTRPPVDAGAERELWQRLAVDTVVTKEGGEAGGVAVKQAVARQLGVRLVVIARPTLAYPRQTADLSEVLAFAQKFLHPASDQ